MKKTLTLTALAAALVLPHALFAKDPTPKKETPEQVAAKFDTNHNGKIDKGDEAETLRAAFEADKDGPLKKFDTNHNGNLEDSEIAAIHVPLKKMNGKYGKK